MMTLILDYTVVSPAVVVQYVLLSSLNAWVSDWKDIDEDFFEVTLDSIYDDDGEGVVLMASEIMEIWRC